MRIIIILAITLFYSIFAEARKNDQVQPNIIWIMADDMGYGDAGCYGQKLIKTPNIDTLSTEGMRFTNAYAGSTVCAPSRSVLMTGKHAGHTRVRGNFGIRGGVVGLGGGKGRVPLRAKDLTVAEILKTQGYTTGLVGKWGLGEPKSSGAPNKKGFDFFFGFYNQRRAHNHYPDFLWLNEERFDLPGNSGRDHQSQYAQDLFSSYAMNFIRQSKDVPFFLYISFTVPHSKFQAPNLGEYDQKNWTDEQKFYAAMISRMDSQIGDIVGLVDSLGKKSNTVIFFCSDNGAANRYEGRFDSSGALRGRKREMYEGGIRTPMIVRWPGKIKAHSVDHTPWYFADFLPTVAHLAGGRIPDDIDGMDISEILLGKATSSSRKIINNRFLYWEFYERGFQQAVRWKNWKAVKLKWNEPIELYDLSRDISESRNIAAIHPEVVAQFEFYLKNCRIPSEEFPSPLD